jgi:integrase
MIHTLSNGTKVLEYIPYKKRTHNNPQQVKLPLNPNALAIIEKYSGQSKGGYLLPFPMNETHWDISTKDGNDKWRIASNTVLGNINAHLKKVGTLVGVDGLTLYYFRRSVFSHVASTGVNSTLLAKHGGTSVRMLEKHYIKDTELQPLVF